MKKSALIGFLLASCFLLLASYQKLLPLSLVETFGFLTGLLCVWLVVQENIWNWPIGIANNIFFVILFWQSRLFADMTLQLIYIALGIIGWHQWLYGGQRRAPLKISRIRFPHAIVVALVSIAATALLTLYLRSVQDAAPFLDAATTVLSLAAQYLLTLKLLENWHVWIVSDVLYIGLYFYKDLTLTALLYAVFLALCFVGWRAWSFTLSGRPVANPPSGAPSLP